MAINNTFWRLSSDLQEQLIEKALMNGLVTFNDLRRQKILARFEAFEMQQTK
jgi:hypothetical protein